MKNKLTSFVIFICSGMAFLPSLVKGGGPEENEIVVDPSSQIADDVVAGCPDASTELIVYSAFTCTHCGDFHLGTLPQLIKKYGDSGKLRIVIRDFPLDKVSLAAAKLARADGVSSYMKIAHTFYHTQKEWLEDKKAIDILKRQVVALGVSAEKVEAALVNKTLEDQLLNTCVDAMKRHKLDSTPTVIIGDQVFPFAATLEDLAPHIEKTLKKGGSPSERKLEPVSRKQPHNAGKFLS